MNTRSVLIVSLGFAIAVGGVAWKALGNASSSPKVLTRAQKAEQSRKSVERLRSSSNPVDQDKAPTAQMRMAYDRADRKDFVGARDLMLQVAKENRGTGKVDPAFGGIQDQAAYQAAVCLVALNRKDEALREFRSFMREHSRSPLVHAAFRRIKQLTEGKLTGTDAAALQRAVSEQEHAARLASKMCGPKALEYVLQRTAAAPSLDLIAQRCHVTDEGTSIAGMLAAFESFGISAEAGELNVADFLAQRYPLIRLEGDHYTVVTRVTTKWLEFYDPLDQKIHEAPAPKPDDTRFRAVVIACGPLCRADGAHIASPSPSVPTKKLP